MTVVRKKCWPEWFGKFVSGERKIELRLADFDLKTGDRLVMEEYDPKKRNYTGRRASFKCKRVERTSNQLQFYKPEEIKKHGFWLIELEKDVKT